jgi:LuxR family quorum-sensing transcriptional regulator LasR
MDQPNYRWNVLQNARLDDFISRLVTTRSVQRSWDEVVSFQKSLGFDLIEYGYAAAGAGGVSPGMEVVTLSNFPTAYRNRYRQERYCRNDPVVRHCINSLLPRPVGRDALDQWPDCGRSLSAVQRRIVDEAAECGMKVGVTIPLRSLGRFPLAGISLSNAMHPVEFGRLMTEYGQLAHLAVLYAHTHMQMLLQTPGDEDPAVVLTSRERECLLWVSRGLSSKKAGEQMGLSARTVDFHVANAMDKFGVATRGQAVLRAVTLGLLEP